MTKRLFQAGETILNQNDISTGLLVIESGSIKIKRDISLSYIASKSFYSNKPLNEKFQNTKMRSHIKISLSELGPGDLSKLLFYLIMQYLMMIHQFHIKVLLFEIMKS